MYLLFRKQRSESEKEYVSRKYNVVPALIAPTIDIRPSFSTLDHPIIGAFIGATYSLCKGFGVETTKSSIFLHPNPLIKAKHKFNVAKIDMLNRERENAVNLGSCGL